MYQGKITWGQFALILEDAKKLVFLSNTMLLSSIDKTLSLSLSPINLQINNNGKWKRIIFGFYVQFKEFQFEFFLRP